MFTNTSAPAPVRSLASPLAVLSVILFSSSAAAQMSATGVLDAGRNAGVSVLVGGRGFSATIPLSLNDDFPSFGVSGCNGDPLRCTPGATLAVNARVPEATITATLDGATYRSNCFSCTTGFLYQTTGSVTLPPIAPTATATGRFSIMGSLSPQGQQPVSFGGTGTVTLYLHSPSAQGYPNSWYIDRAVLRLDSSLPEPWASVDVGSVGTAGNASGTVTRDGVGMFDVAGAGGDIWGTNDAFRFTFAYPAGGEIVARVDGEQNTNPFAKAGVMLRASFSADAPNALLDVKPDGGIEFLVRSVTGASTQFVAGAAAAFPVWLRMSRTADQITAWTSADGQAWQEVGSVPSFSASFTGLAVTSHDRSVLNEAIFSQVSVVDSPTDALPNAWLQTDVGNVSIQGSASVNGGELTINGDGGDIWGAADAFHFVYQQFLSVNDGSIIARVTSLTNTSPYAKAGVMFRTSALNAAAGHVLLDIKPDGGIEFMTRSADSGQTTFVAGGFQAMPSWLKLTKTGQTFTAAVSFDGTSWSSIGSLVLPDTTRISTVGVAVTSHDSAALTMATIDSLSVTQTQAIPVPWQTNDIGATGLAGSATYDSGSFIVNGAGGDIWGDADAFRFVFQARNADPSALTARVVSETNTNPYAKAGVMLRSDWTSARAAFVLIDVKPNGEIEVLQRPQDGGLANYLGGAFSGFGAYLRLQRFGSTVAVSYSADGSAWTTLVTTTVAMPSTAGIGFVVTSHDTTQLNTAVFDNVTGP